MLTPRLLGLSAALLCVAAAPASAQEIAANTSTNQSQAQASDAAATSNPQVAEAKKICKMLPSSGTRFSKRTCLTEKEWKQVEEEVKE